MFEEYDDILSLDDLCKALKLSRNSAKAILLSGELQAMKIGNIWKIPKVNLVKYIETKCNAITTTVKGE